MPWRDAHRAQPDSWFGVTQAQLERELDLLSPLGLTLVRFELPWPLVAPERPGGSLYDSAAARAPDWSGYRWQEADRLISACFHRGLQPVPQVVFSPTWAAPGASNQPPANPQFFGDFMQALACRYRDTVTYWEAWNEPNLKRYWDGTLEKYAADILTEAMRALQDLEPRPKLLIGGLAGSDGLPTVLASAGKSFDVASFHYYPPRRFPALRNEVKKAVRRIRAELKNAGLSQTPAWLTEFGAMASPAEPLDHMPVAGPMGQLRLLKRSVYTSDADALFWYTLRDHVICSGGGIVKRVYWGLFDMELRPRPAARWLAELAQERRAEIT